MFSELPVVDVAPDVVLGATIAKSNNEILKYGRL